MFVIIQNLKSKVESRKRASIDAKPGLADACRMRDNSQVTHVWTLKGDWNGSELYINLKGI